MPGVKGQAARERSEETVPAADGCYKLLPREGSLP
jgi:hypothetical protein